MRTSGGGTTRFPRVSILASGVALGVYVPARLLERGLSRQGVEADVFVLESLYTETASAQLARMKKAYHENFGVARMAHRLPTSALDGIDRGALEEQLERWSAEGRKRFVVWSGFWLELLEEYARRFAKEPLDLDLCRIDAVPSTSFRGREVTNAHAREVWFFRADRGTLEHGLAVDDRPPVAFGRRERLFAHGGGWGIGTYRERALELAEAGFDLDVVVDLPGESNLPSPRHAEYRVDPSWCPWHAETAEAPRFPPFGRVLDDRYAAPSTHHAAYDLVRRSLAIVSKPGGGTLIDSLAAATPIVFLEPYGPAEAENARVFTELGLALPFETWRDHGFDRTLLERCHANLLAARAQTIDYAGEYARRLRQEPGERP